MGSGRSTADLELPGLTPGRRSALGALVFQSRALLLLVPFAAKLWLAS